jgi:hypothetical protein
MLWTPEKISTLPLQDVKNLAINAEAKGNQEVAALCAAELLSRKPKPKPIVGMPDGFIKVTRTPAGKRLEAEVAERLVALAHEVSNVFRLELSDSFLTVSWIRKVKRKRVVRKKRVE